VNWRRRGRDQAEGIEHVQSRHVLSAFEPCSGRRRWYGWRPVLTLLVLVSGVLPTHGQSPSSPSSRTIIYFVRHGEVDNSQPTRPLDAAGRERARVLVATLQGEMLTHVFSSHTTRTRQMVEAVALPRGLAVVALPSPGSRLDGKVVSDATFTGAAVRPLTDALRRLPPGSRALVGVNRENVFAVMNALGVPVATPSQPCRVGGSCVPCLTAACFPGGPDGDYDHLWVLTIDPALPVPQLVDRRYGK